MQGNRRPGRTRHRQEDNIKINLQEVRWRGMWWIYLAQDRGMWRKWTFGFHAMRGNSWLAENLLVTQDRLHFLELVTYITIPSSRAYWTLPLRYARYRLFHLLHKRITLLSFQYDKSDLIFVPTILCVYLTMNKVIYAFMWCTVN
jgi:hypothetical protein